MAKSFYTIIDEGTLDVMHQGEEVTLTLPEWVQELKGKLEDAEALLAWAKEYGVLLAMFHLAIQQLIIVLRAIARAKVALKTGATKSIIKHKDAAQERLDEFVLREISRPKESKSLKAKQVERETIKKTVFAMMDAGQDADMVHAILDDTFGKLEVSLAINAYTEND